MPYRPKKRRKRQNIRTDRTNAYQKLYNRRWATSAKAYRQEHPYCVLCSLSRRYKPSTLVDHIIPHEGDLTLFWDVENWQALCGPCHQVKTRIEMTGRRYWWQPNKSRIVISGKPGAGKSHALAGLDVEHVWDMDVEAAAMGWPEYPRPKFILNRLLKSRREFIQQMRYWPSSAMIITNHYLAFDVAQSLHGRHLAVI